MGFNISHATDIFRDRPWIFVLKHVDKKQEKYICVLSIEETS